MMDRKRFIFCILVCLTGFTSSIPLRSLLSVNETSDTTTDPDSDLFRKILEMNKEFFEEYQEGDILTKTGRSAVTCKSCLWPKSLDGTVRVPYTLCSDYMPLPCNISTNHFPHTNGHLIVITNFGQMESGVGFKGASDVKVFENAMQEFETLTCVRFIPRTEEEDFLNIISQGCTSFIRRIGGSQMVGIDTRGCVVRGVIQHELNHALGFYHEHTRSDRDDYVDINFQFISKDDESNFIKQKTNNLGLSYDYSSVMHYDKFAFTNTTNQPTIVPKPDPNVPIGQRNGLSILDIAKINQLYPCSVCAHLLIDYMGVVNSADYPSAYDNNVNCVWLIRTPSGQVTLNFKVLGIQSSPGCASDYIKVYDGPSRKSPVLLEKTCGRRLIPLLKASSNQMLVEFVSDSSVTGTGFKAEYNSVNR